MTKALSPIPDVMTFEEFLQEPYTSPYSYDIEFRNSLLRYLGVEHSNVIGGETIRHVKGAFSRTAPDIVICERLSFSRHQPERERDLIELGTMQEEEVIRNCWESGYVAWRAQREGVAVIGAEPEFRSEVEFLLEAGFSREALFALYTFRVIPQWLRQGAISPLEEYLRPFLSRLHRTEIWSERECTIEYMREIGEAFWGGQELYEAGIDACIQRVEPSYNGTGSLPMTAVNYAHRESIMYRDRYILSEILWALKTYERVLVVYGGQHAVAQERTLRALATTLSGDPEACLREWRRIASDFARAGIRSSSE